ncbi:unnamed protein product, partial [Sphenostylis stenocarpa]
NSGGYVKRIRDEDIEVDEQLDQLLTGHGETSRSNPKKQKVSEDHPSKPTDTLTKASLDDSGKENARAGGKHNSLVRISVTKKPMTFDGKSPAQPEQMKVEDNKTNIAGGLQSLCQNYGSDDED